MQRAPIKDNPMPDLITQMRMILPQDPALAFVAGVAVAAIFAIAAGAMRRRPAAAAYEADIEPRHAPAPLPDAVRPARVAALEVDLARARAKVQEAHAKSLQAAPPSLTMGRIIQQAELDQLAWRAAYEAGRAQRLAWRAHYFAARTKVLERARHTMPDARP